MASCFVRAPLLTRAFKLLLWLLVVFSRPADASTASLLQLFAWPYDAIAEECGRLGRDGWTAIQISPVFSHVRINGDRETDLGEKQIYPWEEMYQPISWRFHSRLGNETQLRNMVDRCADSGIFIIADVVMNHLAAMDNCCDTATSLPFHDEEYPPCPAAAKIFDPSVELCVPNSTFPHLSLTQEDFHLCGIDDYGDAEQVKDCGLSGLPDMKTESPKVQRLLRSRLEALLELGVGGFRVDAAKHMWPGDLDKIFDGLPDVAKKTQDQTASGKRPFILPEVLPTFSAPQEGLRNTDYINIGGNEGANVTFFHWAFRLREIGLCPWKARHIWEEEEDGAEGEGEGGSRCLAMNTLPQWFSEKAMVEYSSWYALPSGNAVTFVSNHDTERSVGMSAIQDYKCQNGTELVESGEGMMLHNNDSSCELDMLSPWSHPNQWVLLTIFTFTMPYGTPRLYSSYDWPRRLIELTGDIFDEHGWVGPPRYEEDSPESALECPSFEHNGSAPLLWGDVLESHRSWDATPQIDTDGTHFNCEHRLPALAALPRLRKAMGDGPLVEVNNFDAPAAKAELQESVLTYGRGGRCDGGGWVALNFHPSLAATNFTFSTALPKGSYCNLGASYWSHEASKCENREALVKIDEDGLLNGVDMPPEGFIILSTDASDVDTANESCAEGGDGAAADSEEAAGVSPPPQPAEFLEEGNGKEPTGREQQQQQQDGQREKETVDTDAAPVPPSMQQPNVSSAADRGRSWSWVLLSVLSAAVLSCCWFVGIYVPPSLGS